MKAHIAFSHITHLNNLILQELTFFFIGEDTTSIYLVAVFMSHIIASTNVPIPNHRHQLNCLITFILSKTFILKQNKSPLTNVTLFRTHKGDDIK